MARRANKLTKADAQHLSREIHEILVSHGEHVGDYYRAMTDYGPLNLRIDISAGDEVATVFARFEDTASLPGDANQSSGKWNFHCWASEASFFPALVDGALNRIRQYEIRVQELESEGMTRSDAQAIADAEE